MSWVLIMNVLVANACPVENPAMSVTVPTLHELVETAPDCLQCNSKGAFGCGKKEVEMAVDDKALEEALHSDCLIARVRERV
jgi:hypothetical protein